MRRQEGRQCRAGHSVRHRRSSVPQEPSVLGGLVFCLVVPANRNEWALGHKIAWPDCHLEPTTLDQSCGGGLGTCGARNFCVRAVAGPLFASMLSAIALPSPRRDGLISMAARRMVIARRLQTTFEGGSGVGAVSLSVTRPDAVAVLLFLFSLFALLVPFSLPLLSSALVLSSLLPLSLRRQFLVLPGRPLDVASAHHLGI